jgi:hypothetical protein
VVVFAQEKSRLRKARAPPTRSSVE